jgi:hypothetical protein
MSRMKVRAPHTDEAFAVSCLVLATFRAKKPTSWEEFERGAREVLENHAAHPELFGLSPFNDIDYLTEFSLDCIRHGFVLFIENPGFEVPAGVILHGPGVRPKPLED